jgi:hypothetical protein
VPPFFDPLANELDACSEVKAGEKMERYEGAETEGFVA